MFKPRTKGVTLRRAEAALYQPHPGPDRFDPDFPVTYRCDKCGRVGHGPRATLQEAIREHMESDCPARLSRENQPQVMQLLYPRL